MPANWSGIVVPQPQARKGSALYTALLVLSTFGATLASLILFARSTAAFANLINGYALARNEYGAYVPVPQTSGEALLEIIYLIPNAIIVGLLAWAIVVLIRKIRKKTAFNN